MKNYWFRISYLNTIGALYLTNNTRPDIVFFVNVLAKYRYDPTHRHQNGIKHAFHYLCGTHERD
jgi:hypothetical protein